jgi:cytochrome c
MDSFELNKIAAGIIIALLVGMVGSLISKGIISPTMLEKNVFEVAVADTGATSDPGASAKKEAEPIEALLAGASVENGEKIAQKICSQCHTYDQGGANKIGPNLWGIVGSKIAHHEGFAYSAAFKSQTIEWSYENLNKLLFKPRDFIPGTKMSFVGLAKPQERADIIAYLRSLSTSAKPLP